MNARFVIVSEFRRHAWTGITVGFVEVKLTTIGRAC